MLPILGGAQHFEPRDEVVGHLGDDLVARGYSPLTLSARLGLHKMFRHVLQRARLRPQQARAVRTCLISIFRP